MKRTFNFGKIAYYGNRKINTVTIGVKLADSERGPVFTASGEVWNASKTEVLTAGQCLDSVYNYISDPLFKEIHRLWKAYHLNDMHAGTTEQEDELERYHKETGKGFDFTADREHLKEVGLYEVAYNGSPYRYGQSWLYREIPEKDLQIIKNIISNGTL